MFDKATRMKLRFDTNVGRLSVEDLWDLPLTSTNSKTPNLDDLAIQLDQQVSETQRTSFVKKSAQNRSNTEARLKLDVVLHIIQVRVAEAEAAETRKQNADKKQKLMELIEQKQDETLKSKSVEELQALVSSL